MLFLKIEILWELRILKKLSLEQFVLDLLQQLMKMLCMDLMQKKLQKMKLLISLSLKSFAHALVNKRLDIEDIKYFLYPLNQKKIKG